MDAYVSFRQLTKPLALTIVVALLGLASPPGYAGGGPRHIAIDFGYSTPTTGTNDSNGEAWEINPGTCDPLDQDGSSAVGCVLDYSTATAATISSGPVSLGFDVNLNGVTYKQLHVNQNGVVTFVTALGTYAPVTDFASLQTIVGAGNPFIAAFYPGTTALSIPLAGNPADMGFNGGAEYGRGLANPTGTDIGTNPDIDGDVLAFKATWIECPAASSNANCVTFPTNPVQARIVLYNRYDGTSATTDGDFDLRFEYNSVYDTGSSAGGQFGVIGFSLGSAANTLNLSGQSTAPTSVPGLIDIYYQFRKGVLVGAVTAVPNVVNDTLANATTAITAAGLIVGTTTTQSSTTVASGSVISQDPAAGASAASGSAVNLVLSSGPRLVSVPNVVNDTLAAATSALHSAGLKVGTITKQTSSSVPAGSIISQKPAAGVIVAAGSAVNLVVSTGALRGDVNHDGQVDILDLIAILEAFDKKVGPGDPRDLNGDLVINLKDASILVSLCTHHGCAR